MPLTVTDSDAFTDPVTTIADGEALDAAHLSVDSQALANRTRYVKNRLPVSIPSVEIGSMGFTATSVFAVDVTGASLTLSAAPGDVLDVSALLSMNHAAGVGFGAIAIVDGAATTTSQDGVSNTNDAVKYDVMPMATRYVVVNGGTITVKLQAQCTQGSFLCETCVLRVTKFPKL